MKTAAVRVFGFANPRFRRSFDRARSIGAIDGSGRRSLVVSRVATRRAIDRATLDLTLPPKPRKPGSARADRTPPSPRVPRRLGSMSPSSRAVGNCFHERFPRSLRQAASPPLRVVRPRAAPLPAASRRVTPTRATRARPAAAETARTPPRLPASLTRLAAAARRDAARGMTIRPLRTGPNTRGGARAALALAATLNPPTGRTTPTAPATLAAAKGRTSPASPRRIWIRSRTPYRARAPGRMRSRAS